MIDKNTAFDNALISSIGFSSHRNMKARVKDEVINRCVERGLLYEEDQLYRSKKYQWVCEVIDNDFSALCLLRKGNPTVDTSADLKDLFCDIEDMCEAIIEDLAKRIMDEKISYVV